LEILLYEFLGINWKFVLEEKVEGKNKGLWLKVFVAR